YADHVAHVERGGLKEAKTADEAGLGVLGRLAQKRQYTECVTGATTLFLCSVLPLVASTRVDLKKGWTIQSSAKVAGQSEAISTAGFNTAGLFRDESAIDPGDDLSDRRDLLQLADAGR